MKLQKQFKALLMAAMMFCACFAASGYAEAAYFEDVGESHPYYDAIVYCYENNIYTGMSADVFNPEGELTRAMFVTLLGRVAENAGLDLSGYAKSGFTDVVTDSWYSRYVDWAAKKGIVNGTSDTTFEPEASITREQALTIVVRFADVTYLELKSDDNTVFSDISQVSGWAASAVKTAVAAGLAAGYKGGNLAPQTMATRAETADILYRLCELYVGEKLLLNEILDIYVPVIKGLPVNSYASESFTTVNGFKHYEDNARSSVLGIDVSAYQGEIDWAAVKAAGVEFAIIRAGYRGYGSAGTLNTDEYFHKNIQGALENGVKVGVYFFSQAISVAEAVEEANYVLSLIDGYSITYPVAFDWEMISGVSARTDGLSGETLTECAAAFCNTVAAAGYTPMVYSNQALALLRYDLSRLQNYNFWLAEYNPTPGFYYDFQMWQYSDSGVVSGIKGNVDMNLSFVNYTA